MTIYTDQKIEINLDQTNNKVTEFVFQISRILSPQILSVFVMILKI